MAKKAQFLFNAEARAAQKVRAQAAKIATKPKVQKQPVTGAPKGKAPKAPKGPKIPNSQMRLKMKSTGLTKQQKLELKNKRINYISETLSANVNLHPKDRKAIINLLTKGANDASTLRGFNRGEKMLNELIVSTKGSQTIIETLEGKKVLTTKFQWKLTRAEEKLMNKRIEADLNEARQLYGEKATLGREEYIREYNRIAMYQESAAKKLIQKKEFIQMNAVLNVLHPGGLLKQIARRYRDDGDWYEENRDLIIDYNNARKKLKNSKNTWQDKTEFYSNKRVQEFQNKYNAKKVRESEARHKADPTWG